MKRNNFMDKFRTNSKWIMNKLKFSCRKFMAQQNAPKIIIFRAGLT